MIPNKILNNEKYFFIIVLIALVACCNVLAAQGYGHGKIVISAVSYRSSNPEQRELFNKFTYYIRDDLVLRKEDPEDTIFRSTTEEQNKEFGRRLTAKINTPTYVVALKTGQVYTYAPDSLKIHKVSDLETFMDDIPFKAQKYLHNHYVISNIDTTSITKRKTVANITCFLGKATLNGVVFKFAYSKEKLPIISPLNTYVPELPYQVLWVSVPGDHDSGIISELVVEELSGDIPHFVEKYFNIY